MNSDSTPAPASDSTSLTGETAASAYIATALSKARQTLKRTQVIGTILILAVGVYTGVISAFMVKSCRPEEAAQIASGMLSQHAAERGPALAAEIEKEIPALIGQAPDYLIREIPLFRKDLQRLLEAEYRAYCITFSKKLGEQTDILVNNHEAEIKTLLECAGDRTAIRQIIPEFDQTIARFIRDDADGRALKKHIDRLAAALKEIENRMDRLANGADLTSEEQKARRALAILARMIEENTRMPESASIPLANARP
jgi:hypothetical protein